MNLIRKQASIFPSIIEDYFNQDWNLRSVSASMPSVNIKELETQFEIDLAVPGKRKMILKLK